MLFVHKLNKKRNKIIKSSKNIKLVDPTEETVETVNKIGIVVIISTDPLSKLFTYISKIKYSLIGTYDDKNEIISLCYIFNNEKPHWLGDITSLEKLEYLSNIYNIVKIPFNNNEGDNNNNTCDRGNNNNTCDDGGNNKQYNTMELLKILFKNPYDLPSLSFNPCSYKNINKTPNDLITYLDNNLNLLLSNKISIYTEGEKYNEGEILINYEDDNNYLHKIVDTFTDMMINDDEFINILQKYNIDLSYYEMLAKYKDNNSYINLIKHKLTLWIENGSLDKDDDIFEDFKINPDMIVINYDPSPEVLESVTDLHYQISNIINVIGSKTPIIDLNNMIATLNTLSEFYNIKLNSLPIIKTPISIIVTHSPDITIDNFIPISMSTKQNKIVLSTLNYDLTKFTKSELNEILKTVNIIDPNNKDCRYDNIKSDILLMLD